jgi:FkbM family methyltransferase
LDLDFLEIGTSDVDTLIEKCTDDTIGISVEPIKYYLDKLPTKKNVKKINIAITGDQISNKIKIYYVPFDTIIKENLPLFFRGCNKVGDYHQLHIDFNIQHLVKIEEVDLINIGDFLIHNNIRKINHLKIDTEGYEINILKGLYNHISKLPEIYHPNEILFETNTYGVKFFNEVNEILTLYYNIGYELEYSNIIPRQCTDTLIKKIK